MNSEPRQYKDVSGNPCSLDWLVRNEPEWAANQIRHRDKLASELDEIRAVFQHGADDEGWKPGTSLAEAVAKLKASAESANNY